MRTAHALALLSIAAVSACARSGSGDRADTTGLMAGGAGDSTIDTLAAGGAPGAPTPAESTMTGTAGGDRPPPRPPRGSTNPSPASRPTSRPASQPATGGGTADTPPPGRPAESSGGASMDTVRGIAAVVGATPITEVIVRPTSGRPITLTGPLAREVGVASGADVWVRGRRVDDRTIEVTSYAVRTVDGRPALTGTLTADGGRLVLVTDDGRRHPIARPPAPLRELTGARVWITGDLSTTITAYGVLRRAR